MTTFEELFYCVSLLEDYGLLNKSQAEVMNESIWGLEVKNGSSKRSN